MFARGHSAHGTGYYSLYAALTVGESRILHFPNILQRPRISALHSRFSTTQTRGEIRGEAPLSSKTPLREIGQLPG